MRIRADIQCIVLWVLLNSVVALADNSGIQAAWNAHGRGQIQKAIDMNGIGVLYSQARGSTSAGTPFYKRVLEIREKSLSSRDPMIIDILRPYAGLLRAMKRSAEAEKLEDRVHFLTKGHFPQRSNR